MTDKCHQLSLKICNLNAEFKHNYIDRMSAIVSRLNDYVSCLNAINGCQTVQIDGEIVHLSSNTCVVLKCRQSGTRQILSEVHFFSNDITEETIRRWYQREEFGPSDEETYLTHQYMISRVFYSRTADMEDEFKRQIKRHHYQLLKRILLL